MQRNMVQRGKKMAFTSEVTEETVSNMMDMDFAMKEAMDVQVLLLEGDVKK